VTVASRSRAIHRAIRYRSAPYETLDDTSALQQPAGALHDVMGVLRRQLVGRTMNGILDVRRIDRWDSGHVLAAMSSCLNMENLRKETPANRYLIPKTRLTSTVFPSKMS
jgi:hypothetical protein